MMKKIVVKHSNKDLPIVIPTMFTLVVPLIFINPIIIIFNLKRVIGDPTWTLRNIEWRGTIILLLFQKYLIHIHIYLFVCLSTVSFIYLFAIIKTKR